MKGSQRKSGSKKMGAVDVDLHEETEVFTTRDGHKKQVTTEEKKRLEWLKKNHEIDEKANVKPPAPVLSTRALGSTSSHGIPSLPKVLSPQAYKSPA